MREKTQQSPWLHSRFVDLATGCGSWSLPLILIATAIGASHRVELGAAFYFLAVFCNNPHYMATLYRAYGGKKEFKRYRIFSLYLTILIGIAGVIAHSLPSFVPWLVTLYLVWSPWHYTGQNFGISMLMSRRAGVPPNRNARNLLYLSYCASYFVWLLELIEMSPSGAISLTWQLPIFLSTSLKATGIILFITSSSIGFYLLAKESRKIGQLLAPALLHSTQFLWFLLPSITSLFSSVQANNAYFSAGILAFMHCAQYLWITSYFAKKEAIHNGKAGKINWSPWRYFALLTIGGIALFTPGPWIVSKLFGQDLFQSAIVFTALVNIHHFMLDGAIWKLRDGRIGRFFFGAQANGHGHAEEDEIDQRPNILVWICSQNASARLVRWTSAVALLGLAFLDQTQNLLTLSGSSIEQVALAQKINPNDSRVSLRLAQLQISQGNLDTAIQTLETERERSPNNLAILHLLARLHFQSGHLPQAASCYAQILALTPEDQSALTNRSLIAMQEKDWETALPLLQKSVDLDPENPQANLLLGISAHESQQFNYAIGPLEIYLQLAGLSPSENALDSVLDASARLADCYDRTGSPALAANLRAANRDLETLR